MEKEIIILLLLCRFSVAVEELNPEGVYCLSYTWLGPDYADTPVTDEDDEEVKMKCSDFISLGNNSNTPCVDPLVFSVDTISKPDSAELWAADKAAVSCRKSAIQSCVTYTTSFNGLITYQSHLCTRVRTKTAVIRSGCLKEKRNNIDIEVCICESKKGLDLPCNSAINFAFATPTIVLGLVVNLLSYFNIPY